MEETMGGFRTAVTWHPSDRRPQEPSIACQILLRGLLEGVHSSYKSYLVHTPGFTGQGFILICTPRLVLKVLLHFGLLLFPVLELMLPTLKYDLTSHCKSKETQKHLLYKWEQALTNSPTWRDNWKVAQSLTRARARARNSEALCLLLWTSHRRNACWEASGKDENAQRHVPAHTAKIPEIHRRYSVCLKDRRLQHHWSLQFQRQTIKTAPACPC